MAAWEAPASPDMSLAGATCSLFTCRAIVATSAGAGLAGASCGSCVACVAGCPSCSCSSSAWESNCDNGCLSLRLSFPGCGYGSMRTVLEAEGPLNWHGDVGCEWRRHVLDLRWATVSLTAGAFALGWAGNSGISRPWRVLVFLFVLPSVEFLWLGVLTVRLKRKVGALFLRVVSELLDSGGG